MYLLSTLITYTYRQESLTKIPQTKETELNYLKITLRFAFYEI